MISRTGLPRARISLVAVLFLVLGACGGGDGGGGSPAPSTFTVGGTVAGLATGAFLTLLDNNTDPLTVNAAGAFIFSAAIASNGTYSVTVKTQPAGQSCAVSNAGGSATANVTNISVECTGITYSIGGSVSGLAAGTTLTLLDNNTDTLTISGDGTFTFATSLTANASYAVTVGSQPSGQSCTLSNASGTVTAAVVNIVVACGKAAVAILQLGHGGSVTGIEMTETRVLSQDIFGDWLLSGLNPDVTVASGTSGCLSSSCIDAVKSAALSPIPIALAGQTVVIETPTALAIRSAADGNVEGTIPGPMAWWSLASDGSYVVTGSQTALQAWSISGKLLFGVAGNYAAAVVFAAPTQIQVALGAAGVGVIQTIAVPSGTAVIGPPFNGAFNSWFLDGGRFLTSAGQSVWVYSAGSVQQGLAQLTSVGNLTGQGNWFWSFGGADEALSLYAVGSSGTAAATYPAYYAVPSGLTIGIFPYGTAQVTIVDLSGATPADHTYSLPVPYDSTFAAASAMQWVVGNQNGVVVDTTTIPSTPQFLSQGAAVNIAGGGNVAAIATAAGTVYVINPATQTVQNSFAILSSQVALSVDGTVLAVLSDENDKQYSVDPPTLSVFSLPAGSLTHAFPNASGFSLSGSGTLIEMGGAVTSVNGGPSLWTTSNGFLSFLFAPTGSDFVTKTQSIECAPFANFYENYALTNTDPGSPAGWIDQSHILVNAYGPGLGACAIAFTSASIYDAAGTLVSATALPELKSIQPISTDSVYSLDRNTIYSLTTGQATWTGPVLFDLNATGAVAGNYVVYPSGASVVAVAY